MALDKKKRTIGGVEYEVTQLDAVRGRRVFTRFMKLMAPALSKVATLQGVEGDEAAGRFFEGLAEITKSIEEDDIDFFCDAFAPTTSIISTNERGQVVAPKLSGQFELHFAGRYVEMLEWIMFCCEVNFGSFFERLGLGRKG